MTLTSLSHWFTLAWGWRRILAAFLAGAVTTLALAPANAWPVPFLTFPILVWLIDGSGGGRYGGTLAYRPNPDRGTTFRLELPVSASITGKKTKVATV